jgi:hypothetical protein
MASIRTIAREAETNGFRMSSLILGVVKSPAFQMSRVPATAAPVGEPR